MKQLTLHCVVLRIYEVTAVLSFIEQANFRANADVKLTNMLKVGALGDLETIGGNFAGAVSCTSCSPSADIVWFPNSTVDQSITTSTNYFIFGPDVELEGHLFLNLSDGFSVAGVPEPSTWAMMLIGFAAIALLSMAREAMPAP